MVTIRRLLRNRGVERASAPFALPGIAGKRLRYDS